MAELFDEYGQIIAAGDGGLVKMLERLAEYGVDMTGADLSWETLSNACLEGADLHLPNLANVIM
jgi:uncharacterized protein YjbI with pentapeptide repeats